MSPHITQLPISRRALGLAHSALTALTLRCATMSVIGAGEERFKFDCWQFSQRDLPANKSVN